MEHHQLLTLLRTFTDVLSDELYKKHSALAARLNTFHCYALPAALLQINCRCRGTLTST